MTHVRVRIDDLERGDVPAPSVKSGAPCANPVAIVLRPEQRPWSLRGPQISAVLPLAPARARSRRLLTRVSWAILVACAAALVAAITGAGSVALGVAVLAFVGYIALIVVGDLRWIGSQPSDHEDEVVLTRVNRRFAH